MDKKIENKLGLSSLQARKRLKQYGLNQANGAYSSILMMTVHQLFNPIIMLLIIAAIISAFIGNDIEATIIIGIILLNIFFGTYHEYKAQHIIYALKKQIITNVSVYRDGILTEVPMQEIVPGDYIALKIGNIVPADVFIKQQENLLIDEMQINPNEKNISKEVNIKDNKYFSSGIIYTGSVVKMGTAIVKVFATGAATKTGSMINKAMQRKHITEYEKELQQVGIHLIKIIVITIGILFVLSSLFNPGQDLIQLILFTIAIAFMAIPESLPAISNLILSKGAQIIGNKGAIIKNLTVLENLGNVDIICTDKTGTLTENTLRLMRWRVNPRYEAEFFDYCYMLSHNSKDVFDIAIIDMLNLNDYHPKKTNLEYQDIAFDPFLKESGREFANFAIIKGSEKELLKKSNYNQHPDNENMDGYRRLAIIKKQSGKHIYIASLYFYDPVKKDVSKVFKTATANGLQLKIITGDTLAVSRLVTNDIEFTKDISEFFDADLLQYSEPRILEQQVQKYQVFYNADPVQKFKIIEALQNNATVAYLGDGINDAPALKLADVGIVVKDANDMARDNADMVLTRKSLSIVVSSIIEGRKAFINIEKVLLLSLTLIFCNLLTYIVLSILFKFQPILPIQLIISNLIIELSLFTYVVDNVNTKVLKQPQHRNFPNLLKYSFTIAAIISGINVLFFLWANSLVVEQLQTLWFAIITITSLLLILSFRTQSFFYTIKINRNIILALFISIVVTILLAFSKIIPTNFSILNFTYIPLVILFPIVNLVIVELTKLFLIKRININEQT